MRRTTTSMLAVLATALAAAPARADFFRGETIDGPSADIVRLGDVDVARDGTGAAVYVKRDGGVDHIFVSRLVDGGFQSPERLDAAFAEPGSQPVVAAVDGGRVAVAYVSGTQLYVVLKAAADQPWGAPQALATPASNPSIDMSIHGTAYLSFTAPGGSVADVRVARLDRKATSFEVLADTVDIDPAHDAGLGNGRSQIVVSADGTAVVTWGEAGHVYARRIFETRLSTAPQDLNIAEVDGHAGKTADLPRIDIEDDSSFAWVVFRQQLDDGRFHAIARRLVGTQFEAPTVVDGLGYGADEARMPFVDLNGRGEGIALTGSAGFGAFSSLLHDDQFFPPLLLNPGNGVEPRPVGGVSENNNVVAVWLQGTNAGDAQLHGAFYDIDPAKRTVPPPGPDTVLTSQDLGGVDGSLGLDLGIDRAGDAAAVFVQGSGDAKRLVAAGYDRPPGTFRTYTTSKWRGFARPEFSWAPSLDIWGPVTYRVEIDGQSFGETKDTKLTPVNAVPDGEHNWRVVAVDRRGQAQASPTRLLRVDATPPTITFTLKGARKAGKPLRVAATVSDLTRPNIKASGVQSSASTSATASRWSAARRCTATRAPASTRSASARPTRPATPSPSSAGSGSGRGDRPCPEAYHHRHARGRRGGARTGGGRGRRTGLRSALRRLRTADLQLLPAPGGHARGRRRRDPGRLPQGAPAPSAASGRPGAQLRRLPVHRGAQRELRRDRQAQEGRSGGRDPRVRLRAGARRQHRAPRRRPRAGGDARIAAGVRPGGQRAAARASAGGACAARARGALLRRDRGHHGHEPQLGRPADLARADQAPRRAAGKRAGVRCLRLAGVRARAALHRPAPGRSAEGRRGPRLARRPPSDLRDLPRVARRHGGGRRQLPRLGADPARGLAVEVDDGAGRRADRGRLERAARARAPRPRRWRRRRRRRRFRGRLGRGDRRGRRRRRRRARPAPPARAPARGAARRPAAAPALRDARGRQRRRHRADADDPGRRGRHDHRPGAHDLGRRRHHHAPPPRQARREGRPHEPRHHQSSGRHDDRPDQLAGGPAGTGPAADQEAPPARRQRRQGQRREGTVRPPHPDDGDAPAGPRRRRRPDASRPRLDASADDHRRAAGHDDRHHAAAGHHDPAAGHDEHDDPAPELGAADRHRWQAAASASRLWVALLRLVDSSERPSAREVVAGLRLREGGAEGPRVVAAMIASVDGRTTVDGRSVALGHPEDRELLRELRAGVDAILVGARTLVAERYANLLDPEQRERRVALGLRPHPIVATVSRRLELRAAEVPLFDEPDVPIRVYSEREGDVGPAAADVRVCAVEPGTLGLEAVLADLAREEGVRAISCEGGPALLRELVAQRCLHDLMLTVSPLLVAGSSPTVLAGDPLAGPPRLELHDILRADHHLFLHYRPAP